MKWTDTQDIAMALADAHPDQDPKAVNFVDLYKWVMALPGFSDDPKRCGEKNPRGHPDGVDRRSGISAGRAVGARE